MSAGMRHLLFVPSPHGYHLLEAEGEPPAVGSELALDSGQRFLVSKVARSPLPADPRRCAYLQRVS